MSTTEAKRCDFNFDIPILPTVPHVEIPPKKKGSIDEEFDFRLLQRMVENGRELIKDKPLLENTSNIVASVCVALTDEQQRAYVHTTRYFPHSLTKSLLADITDSIMVRPKLALSLSMLGATPVGGKWLLAVGSHNISASFDNGSLCTIIAFARELVVLVYSQLHSKRDSDELRLLFGSLVHFESHRKTLLLAFGFDDQIYNFDTQSCMPVLLSTLVTAHEKVSKQDAKDGDPFPIKIRQHLAIVGGDLTTHGYNTKGFTSSDVNKAMEDLRTSITPAVLEKYASGYPNEVGTEAKGSQPWHTDSLTGSDTVANAALLVVVNITNEPIESTQVAMCEFIDSSGQYIYHPWLVYSNGPVPTRLPLTSSRVLPLDPIPPGGFAILSPALVHRGAA
jgi:hypothetical protein